MATTNPYSRIQTSDTTLNRIQSQIASAFGSIIGPFLGGNLLTAVSLTAGQDNLIPHKLGRVPQVWVLSWQDTNSVVWSPGSPQLSGASHDQTFINLHCSASCAISLWVN